MKIELYNIRGVSSPAGLLSDFQEGLSSITGTSMEQSRLRETNTFSASEEIDRVLRNPNVHHRVHNNHMVVPVQSQKNPAHILPSYF